MRNRWGVAVKRWSTGLLVAGLGLAGSASATLISRGADLVYDDALNITWTRNANLPGSRLLVWADANAWAANLVFAGFDDWRLPTINLTTPTTTWTECGSVSAAACAASGNELGYMFYQNLAGLLGDNKTGNQTAVGGEVLTGIQTDYWSGTEYEPPNFALYFLFDNSHSELFDSGREVIATVANNPMSAWAVRSGDVSAAVPEPQTYALLLAGLGLLGWRTRQH